MLMGLQETTRIYTSLKDPTPNFSFNACAVMFTIWTSRRVSHGSGEGQETYFESLGKNTSRWRAGTHFSALRFHEGYQNRVPSTPGRLSLPSSWVTVFSTPIPPPGPQKACRVTNIRGGRGRKGSEPPTPCKLHAPGHQAHPPGPGGGGGARTRTPRPRGRSSTFHSTCCFGGATGSSPARAAGGRRRGCGARADWRTWAGRALPGRPERPRANSASRLPRLRSPAPRPGRGKHSGAELDVSGKPGPLSLSFCGRRGRTQAPAHQRGQLRSARSTGAPASTMLDPSSSEEESDEGLEEESREVLVAPGGSQRAQPATAREGRRDAPGRSGGGSGGGAARPVSPSSSVLSEGRDESERQLDEEQERRIRLQLYVFVVRCIAYPFNAKQPTDMARRQQKVSGGTRSFLRLLLPPRVFFLGELSGTCRHPSARGRTLF